MEGEIIILSYDELYILGFRGARDNLFMLAEDGLEVYRQTPPGYEKAKIYHYRYSTVSAIEDGKQKIFNLHRLMAEAFVPNPNNCPVVLHKDGDNRNNSAANLVWATNAERLSKALEEKSKNCAKTRAKDNEPYIRGRNPPDYETYIDSLKIAKFLKNTHFNMALVARETGIGYQRLYGIVSRRGCFKDYELSKIKAYLFSNWDESLYSNHPHNKEDCAHVFQR